MFLTLSASIHPKNWITNWEKDEEKIENADSNNFEEAVVSNHTAQIEKMYLPEFSNAGILDVPSSDDRIGNAVPKIDDLHIHRLTHQLFFPVFSAKLNLEQLKKN